MITSRSTDDNSLTECRYLSDLQAHTTHTLHFGHLHYSGVCDRAFVDVRDGGTMLSPLLGKFCGTTLPSTQHGTGDALYIRYFSDVTDVHTGFKAEATVGKYSSDL